MAITNTFKNAVAAHNLMQIRIMMKDSLLVDPSFKEFREMSELAKNVNDLYIAYDNKPLDLNSANWDDTYMNKQLVLLISNFSYERIQHLQNVIRKLRPITKVEKKIDIPNRKISHSSNNKALSYKEQKQRDKENGTYNRSEKICLGGVAGAVIGGAVASFISSSLIIGIGAGAVVGAVGVSVATNNKENM